MSMSTKDSIKEAVVTVEAREDVKARAAADAKIEKEVEAAKKWMAKMEATSRSEKRKLGELKTGIDSRVDGAISDDYVREIFKRHSSSRDYKYPTYVTEDSYLLTSRHTVRAHAMQIAKESGIGFKDEALIAGSKAMDDIEVPVVVLPFRYGDCGNSELSIAQRSAVRAFAVLKDIPKDKRRGLSDDDLEVQIARMVDDGMSLKAVASLLNPAVPYWKCKEKFGDAWNVVKNARISAARKESERIVRDGGVVDYKALAVKHGLGKNYAIDIASHGPVTRKEATINHLWKKQPKTESARRAQKPYADRLFVMFRNSMNGTLGKGEKYLSAKSLLKIISKHRAASASTERLWAETENRAIHMITEAKSQRKGIHLA